MPTKRQDHLLSVIFDYAARISREREFAHLLDLVTDMGRDLLECDRCTIWLLDRHAGELWSKVSHGLTTTRIPYDTGIVGTAVVSGQPIIINDPYNDARFNRTVDQKSGYTTRSILTLPMFGLDGEVMGAFQAVNKHGGGFTEEDAKHLMLAASFSAKVLDAEYLVEINTYHAREQEKAYAKQCSVITNDLQNSEQFEVITFHKPSDILCGDTYSLHTTENGDILIYVIDAMGHGILPSLTAFSVASAVKRHLNGIGSLQELADEILPSLQRILAEEEQLSCTFIWLDKNGSYADYFSAGMYPAVLHDGEQIHRLGANNLPILNFTPQIRVTRQPLAGFEKLLIASDGVLEDTRHATELHTLLEQEMLADVIDRLNDHPLEDDATLICLQQRR